MDFVYSDPSPAIDYYMRASREKDGNEPSGGGDDDSPGGGCLILLIAILLFAGILYCILK
jgi:hypothetical protein